MIKLSKLQVSLLHTVSAMNLSGRVAHIETGTHKNFQKGTLNSLEKRGLIEYERLGDSSYSVYLTRAGISTLEAMELVN